MRRGLQHSTGWPHRSMRERVQRMKRTLAAHVTGCAARRTPRRQPSSRQKLPCLKLPGGGGSAKAEQREMAGCAHVLKGEQDLAARLSFSRGEGSANRAQGAVCRDGPVGAVTASELASSKGNSPWPQGRSR